MKQLSTNYLHIHFIDNKKFMRRLLKDNAQIFDVCIDDPPYGIGESAANFDSRNTAIKQKSGTTIKIQRKHTYKKSNWDLKPPPPVYFKMLFKLCRHQVIFGANYFKEIVGKTFKPPRRSQFQEFIQQNPKGWIIWDKVNSDNDFNDCELIWTSFEFDSFIVEYMWSGMMQGLSITQGTIQQGNKKLNEVRIHPTQKPVVIYKFLLDFIQVKLGFGDNIKIFDPHVGSGSLAIACHDYKFYLTGCENNPDIISKLQQRIWTHVRQQDLFDEPLKFTLN